MAPVHCVWTGTDLMRDLEPPLVGAIWVTKQHPTGLVRCMPVGLRFHFPHYRCGDEHVGSRRL
jgi:hypothetical protein